MPTGQAKSNLKQTRRIIQNKGTPKWMVNIMENPIKMDDLEENPLFLDYEEYTIQIIDTPSINDTIYGHIAIVKDKMHWSQSLQKYSYLNKNELL